MREIPVDTTKVQFIGTGKSAARAEYAQLSDGSTRRTGEQATDDHGVPIWVVDVLVDDDDADRAEIAGVRVASYDEPQTPKWQPVKFRNLRCKPWADSSGNFTKVAFSWLADGIDGQGGQHKPQENKGQPAA
ncbi:hypothetical protein SAMN05216207_107815 [Pseudonocardia ammonioxydans]|uniref:Uncharacterized protein n=1 Tax=Pseudonocardia ammonioxydans TaxID=260086 RepID=A0A1I5HWU9_PSUAM|nr:hypothetical protein [Pseudonocardia ammonioxydans]SFO52765.1 hypothetical protein SAMN05216207_107815 [Pseudonocardia ammonioxydans]